MLEKTREELVAAAALAAQAKNERCVLFGSWCFSAFNMVDGIDFNTESTTGCAAGRAGQETHELALRKENQMKNLQNAFGLKDAVEGQSFDRELQERKRLERIAEREAREKEKEKLRKEEEKRRKAAAKEAKKAAKAAKKAEGADSNLHKVRFEISLTPREFVWFYTSCNPWWQKLLIRCSILVDLGSISCRALLLTFRLNDWRPSSRSSGEAGKTRL